MQDNIYANGQLIARDHSTDTYIQFGATNSSSGNYWGYTLSVPAGTPIQSGTKLVWREIQSGAAAPEGGIRIYNSSGATASWSLTDQDGETINSDTTQNTWHNRVVDLTPLSTPGTQTVQSISIVADTNTGAGAWDEKFADIAIVQPDGTVTTLYNNQVNGSLGSGFGSSGVSGQYFSENMIWNPYIPCDSTHYFLADHLGSTRMEFAGPGWPVWGEDYAPYGQEVSPTGAPEATSNIYKFTGYERDPETAIAAGTEEDYAQARYYSSAIQGRFMSPDPDLGSMDLANPQSLNRYSYALNNPVKFVDPSGKDCIYLNEDGTDVQEVDPGDDCDTGGYWVPGTYDGNAIQDTDGTLIGFESVENGYGFVSNFNGDGSLASLDITLPYLLPIPGMSYSSTGTAFDSVSQEQLEVGLMTSVPASPSYLGLPDYVSFSVSLLAEGYSVQISQSGGLYFTPTLGYQTPGATLTLGYLNNPGVNIDDFLSNLGASGCLAGGGAVCTTWSNTNQGLRGATDIGFGTPGASATGGLGIPLP